MSLTPSESRAVHDAVAACAALPGALLPALHHLHDRLGYVPVGAEAPLALAFDLSQADVHGVITFYHDFRRAPPGRHVLKLCRAEACQANGASAVVQQAERCTGARLGTTAVDGSVTLEAAYCLGLCGMGPAALVDGVPVGRLTPARLDRILQSFGEGR